jgi:alpha-tubulin suppressor-like RCC1 family protein
LFTWGGGGPSFNKGQCGQGTLKDIISPEPVKFFSSMKVLDFSCGGYHTICMAQEKNGKKLMFGFGSGYYGELGNGDVIILFKKN